jgi:hypothetical protein
MTQLAREERNFCVARFKEYPELWVRSGSSPFIHPALQYSTKASNGGDDAGISPFLQAAYAAAATYSTMTPATRSLGAATINSLSETIISRCRTLSASSTQPGMSLSITEHLAAVQALITIQLLRLFAIDPSPQSSTADSLTAVLLSSWSDSLAARTGHLAHLSAGTPAASAPRISWRAWVLAESVRRSVIMALMIRGVHALVTDGRCDVAPRVTARTFTMQRRLWGAEDAQEWSRAREEGVGEFWIEGMRFGEALSGAGRTDVDELGVLMSVTYCGREAVKEWLGGGMEVVA